MGNNPPPQSTHVERVKAINKKDPDFTRYYATACTAGFYKNDFRIVFQIDDVSELQMRINAAPNLEGKQAEMAKGQNLLQVCEIILPNHVGKQIADLFTKLVLERDTRPGNKSENDHEFEQ